MKLQLTENISKILERLLDTIINAYNKKNKK